MSRITNLEYKCVDKGKNNKILKFYSLSKISQIIIEKRKNTKIKLGNLSNIKNSLNKQLDLNVIAIKEKKKKKKKSSKNFINKSIVRMTC